MDEGFTQLVELFGTYYDLFKKNIQRFKDSNKQWSRVNTKKNIYYVFFSPANWQKLQDTEKTIWSEKIKLIYKRNLMQLLLIDVLGHVNR